ncbi:cytochrome c oxidase subunit II [Paenibacillus cymbidii]|uniref:cytochrome c oxidase subunit II n=1 Tax=Paenibacillus cymbidii TaxID=1639034 RepID=UPI001080D4B7|nr:cytochrome c oxidase subunit II [Paenibacillus cymbidii]
MSSRWKLIGRLLPLLALLGLMAGCGDPYLTTLNPKGPVAKEQLDLIKLSFGIMILVLVVVFFIYIYVLIKFRRRKGQENVIPKQVEGNHLLEIIWTVIPIILLLILAVPTVFYTFKHVTDYSDDKDAIHINVTGHQFWWEFEYADQKFKTAQDLVVPVGKIVSVKLASADVNHSFWIPTLAGKQDTNPGDKNVNTLYFKADEPGTYKGKCAELCGASHTLMDFKVKAVSEAEYAAWLTKMTTPYAAVSADVAAGEQVFKQNCIACHAVTPDGVGSGPNLKGFASRELVAGILEHNDAKLKEWINDPQSVKPGTLMPARGLNEQQLNDVVKYLNTLK